MQGEDFEEEVSSSRRRERDRCGGLRDSTHCRVALPAASPPSTGLCQDRFWRGTPSCSGPTAVTHAATAPRVGSNNQRCVLAGSVCSADRRRDRQRDRVQARHQRFGRADAGRVDGDAGFSVYRVRCCDGRACAAARRAARGAVMERGRAPVDRPRRRRRRRWMRLCGGDTGRAVAPFVYRAVGRVDRPHAQRFGCERDDGFGCGDGNRLPLGLLVVGRDADAVRAVAPEHAPTRRPGCVLVCRSMVGGLHTTIDPNWPPVPPAPPGRGSRRRRWREPRDSPTPRLIARQSRREDR